jgi:hypothetical protein
METAVKSPTGEATFQSDAMIEYLGRRRLDYTARRACDPAACLRNREVSNRILGAAARCYDTGGTGESRQRSCSVASKFTCERP